MSETDSAKVPTTLQAFEPEGRRLITFTDHVQEGDVVDVYDTFEQAEEDEGPHVKMRVCRDEDDWWVEDVVVEV